MKIEDKEKPREPNSVRTKGIKMWFGLFWGSKWEDVKDKAESGDMSPGTWVRPCQPHGKKPPYIQMMSLITNGGCSCQKEQFM